jgi:hypothetical protein
MHISLHTEFIEINRADYDDLGDDSDPYSGYLPLYPLVNGYWDKPLAVMPQALRCRVGKVVPSWDDIDDSYGHSQVATRQERVKLYDIQRDPTEERETFFALDGYLHGGIHLGHFLRGQLQDRINEAISNSVESVADVLREDIFLPLEKIRSEVGIHWQDPKPQLWVALCKFREIKLHVLIDKAKYEKNECLITELGYVSAYIKKILNLDRDRVDSLGEIVSEWKANARAQASPAFVKLEEVISEKPTSMHVLEDGRPCVVKIELKREIDDEELPGKMPRTAVGKLAIKAAWQIECETGRKTSSDKVMERLHDWAKKGSEGELIRPFSNGVVWITKKERKEKNYWITDCGRHLDNWYQSRA